MQKRNKQNILNIDASVKRFLYLNLKIPDKLKI